MKQENSSHSKIEDKPDENLLDSLENSFDWNLIFIAASWIFLLVTFFMIFF